MSQDHLATVCLNGLPVVVRLGHRFAGESYGPTLVTVTAPVALTLEDVVAVLFNHWSGEGWLRSWPTVMTSGICSPSAWSTRGVSGDSMKRWPLLCPAR